MSSPRGILPGIPLARLVRSAEEEENGIRSDERSRHELHTTLEKVLGPRDAATLMAYLPTGGWGNVATRHDLDALEGQLSLRIIRWIVGMTVASVFAVTAIVLAATRLP